jgi:small subunit ribosomal protein S2
MSFFVRAAIVSAAIVVGVAILSLGLQENSGRQTSIGFVAPLEGSSPKQLLTAAGQAYSARAYNFAEVSPPFSADDKSAFIGLTLGLSALAVLASRKRRHGAGSEARVMMMARGQKFMRPSAKGLKPMVNRAICRNIIKQTWEGYTKKHRTLEDADKMIKTLLHGRVQFQFSSEHFTDSMPLMPASGRIERGGSVDTNWAPQETEFYKRKYLEPAKFKKLAIAAWEMPENVTKAVTLQELVQAGVQYGHKSGSWNPKMLQYLYADHQGTHIFDLVQTAACLNRACYYCMEAAARGAEFLMIGTKEQARSIIQSNALRVNAHYCDLRFAGGLLTNFEVVRKSVELMFKLREDKAQGKWGLLSLNERERAQCKLNRLTNKYRGVEKMTRFPDICIFVDQVKESNPLAECHRIGIPTIGLIDSNASPDMIDLPIPGNASGSRSIELVIGKITDAIVRGQEIRKSTPKGDEEAIAKEWDPWVFSKDRMRWIRRRSKRQPWHKSVFGGYEQYKKANPFGNIPVMTPFHEFKWNDILNDK